MAYPGRFQWDSEVTGDTYSTTLIINTKED